MHCLRSFNALEPKLGESTFKNMVGADADVSVDRPSPDTPASRVDRAIRKLCKTGRGKKLGGANRLTSVDTLGRSLKVMQLETARNVSQSFLRKAERNKIFREGGIAALRYFAVDGWEPFCSHDRHCEHCLTRFVEVEQHDGEKVKVPQYYHRYVVAMLIDERLDLVLDIEPLMPSELRVGATKKELDEGELTAAKRLLRRVKERFPWLDVVLADGLYPNGPFLTLVKELHLSGIFVIRKKKDEPLKEALQLWAGKPPVAVVEDTKKHESIELWDCPELRTLSTYDGPIRLVRGVVTSLNKPDEKPKTWCVAVVGKAAKVLTARQVVTVIRGRWHIENTGFHQWTKHWKFAHVFVHEGNAILALFWFFFAAYNLLTLFLYRQVRSYGRDRGKDPTRTILRFVDEMADDLARLTSSVGAKAEAEAA